jgi:hypothetical protein
MSFASKKTGQACVGIFPAKTIRFIKLTRVSKSLSVWFYSTTIWEWSYGIHCCMKCPQIRREKTSSQKYTVIALKIQWSSICRR